MASFLVETYQPDIGGSGFARAVDSVREASESLSREGVHVRHVRSYVVPGDEMCFHVLEAESAEEVEQTLGLAGIKAGRVVEAIGVRSEP